MRKHIKLLFLIIFFDLAAFTIHAEQLFYSLSIDQELYERFNVTIHIKNTDRTRLVFSMPIWLPGSYYVENFGKNVLDFKATNDTGDPVRAIQLSQNDWEVLSEGVHNLVVNYKVQAKDHGFMGPALDSLGALVQGASTWMTVRGLANLPRTVHITPADSWQIATGLEPTVDLQEFKCQNYDELADCPILMGHLIDTTFFYLGKPHEIYFRGEADFSLAEFTAMVEKIVRYQTGLFGGAPYKRYVFQYTILPGHKGGGGLEHRNSTSIGLSALKLLADVNSAANITAHEYFHLWNVKRITSNRLLPLRYDREARMQSLWWLEGVTSYYADLTLVRTGIWSVRDFLDDQEKEIKFLLNNPDRHNTSVAQASWDIWENGYFSSKISYYNKGMLVGLLLDVMVRKVTANRKSLDDVLRYLYKNYAQQGKGFADDDLQAVIEKLTQKDFGPFFDRYITGLVELPFRDVLALAGLDVQINMQDYPTIGPVRFLGKKNRIFSIDANSAAAKAGLRRDDQLVWADGKKITGDEMLAKMISKKKPGDILTVKAKRDGVLITFEVAIKNEQKAGCSIDLLKNASDEQIKIRNGLLNGK
ncbi:MAG: M61 family metallopeptidase [Calditrichaeota bacterium]|nr:M61 family metallopeptidase [Calditrichota bacterium]